MEQRGMTIEEEQDYKRMVEEKMKRVRRAMKNGGNVKAIRYWERAM